MKNKYDGKEISDNIIRLIDRRDNFVERKKKDITIVDGIDENCYYLFSTIISNGDSIGSVIILSVDKPMLETEEKLASILANILSNYFC